MSTATNRIHLKKIAIKFKNIWLLTLVSFLCSSANAQQLLWYSLIDNGACTQSDPYNNCPTFSSTCSTGWGVSNGSPELVPSANWSCPIPCVQGSGYCDGNYLDDILMIGDGPGGATDGEGVFKSFYFQSGVTYTICVFYSITPYSSTAGGTASITFAAENGLQQYTLINCQSSAPTVSPAELIGTAPSNETYASFTFTPSSNYTQFLMFATSTSQQMWTSVVTGLDISVTPVCGTPAITSVVSNTPGGITVTWTSVTGSPGYEFHFTSGGVTTEQGYTVPQALPTGATTFTYTFPNFTPGTYTVSVQAADAACSGGSSPWSPPSASVTVANCTLSSTYIESVEPGANGTANVAWEPVSGASYYNVEFLSGGTVVKSFITSTTTPGGGIEFSGIPSGTYTVEVQAAATCGTGPWATYSSSVSITCLGSTYIESVEPGASGTANVAWEPISGAQGYNVEFVSGGTVVKSFNSTPANPGGGVEFSGIPTGNYTVSVQGYCSSCGTGAWATYSQSVHVN
jgi:hypothetical protein